MRSPNPARDELRKALEHDTAAYLEAGGAVAAIPPGVVARPPDGARNNSHLFDIGRAPAGPKSMEHEP
jgi:hypothetical protein